MQRWILFIVLVAGSLAFVMARGNAPENSLITPAQARDELAANPSTVLLDVRTAAEFAAGYIAGARLLPYDEITAASAAKLIATKDTPVIVYCRSGRRSAIAADTLRGLGYKNVRDLGGIGSWNYGLVK